MKDRSQASEQILNVTLEIIYLLTGENYLIVKKPCECITRSRDPCTLDGCCRTQRPGTLPSTFLRSHAVHNDQKILELTNKIIQLLTGEIPVRCEDVTVYFSTEEWEYVKGHTDLYKDAMMETHQPLGSPGGSTERFHTIVSNPDWGNEDMKAIETDYVPKNTKNNPQKVQVKSEEDSASCETLVNSDVYASTVQTQTDYTSKHVKEKTALCEEGIVLDPSTYIPTDYSQNEFTAFHIKKEPTSDVEDEFLGQTEIQYKSVIIKEEDEEGGFPVIETLTEDIITHIIGDSHEEMDYKSVLVKEEHFSDSSNPSEYIQVTDIVKMEDGEEFSSSTQPPSTLKTFNCSECMKSFNSNSEFVKHQATHKEKRLSCSYCGKSFSYNSHLIAHERIHTGEKPFLCPECGKSFTQNSDLLKHQRNHSEVKPFVCTECGKGFSQNSYLIKHMRFHTGDRQFPCSVCGKCFTQNSDLVKHQRVHTGEKPFACTECGKCFSQHCYLYKHMRFHTGDKRFSCSVCGKCFAQNSDLVKHQRIHTGEKPFSCSECGKCFTQNTHLERHKRFHSGEKPYSCSECGKCFIQNSDLVKHKRFHAGEKTLSCSECSKHFSSTSEFLEHWSSCSSGQSQADEKQ